MSFYSVCLASCGRGDLREHSRWDLGPAELGFWAGKQRRKAFG